MLFALPLLRRLTAVTSVVLVLAGALVSSHAMGAHITGLNTAATAPCHHALESSDQSVAQAGTSALDLCRQLCLNKVPDTAITTAALQSITPSPSLEPALAYSAIPANTLAKTAAAPMVRGPDDRLRRAVAATTQRLLI